LFVLALCGLCWVVLFDLLLTPCAAFASGSRSKATSLLESARAAERAAREQRAAAAERRFATLGVGGGGGDGRAGASQTPATVPWGTGSIAGGPVAAAAAGAPADAVKPFGSAAPAFGGAAASPPVTDEDDAAVAALLERATPAQARLLHRILSNAAENPGDAKLRRLRLSNPKVADALLTSGALHGLLQPRFAWALEAGDGADDEFAVQSEAAVRAHTPAMLRAAARLLAHADAAPV